MKRATIKTRTFGVTALVLGLSVLMSGLMLAPGSASAFWWPWDDNHAWAQDNDDDTVTVTVKKYIDGVPATRQNASDDTFTMSASWDDPDGVGEGEADFELSASTSPAYRAVTAELQVGADYSVREVFDDELVGANCDAGHTYALQGYSVGRTGGLAATADRTDDAPAFTNLTKDMHVIVWNETCDDEDEDPDETPSSGDISGQVTGGSSEGDPGELRVTSIDAEKTTAIANGEFADGWRYVFNITVPEDEPDLAMRFADWVHTTNDNRTIPVDGNMRISSEQAADDATITLTAANTYSSPSLTMTGDLDDDEDGLQVQVLVEVAVPEGTYNGTYSTAYGVRTLE